MTDVVIKVLKYWMIKVTRQMKNPTAASVHSVPSYSGEPQCAELVPVTPHLNQSTERVGAGLCSSAHPHPHSRGSRLKAKCVFICPSEVWLLFFRGPTKAALCCCNTEILSRQKVMSSISEFKRLHLLLQNLDWWYLQILIRRSLHIGPVFFTVQQSSLCPQLQLHK